MSLDGSIKPKWFVYIIKTKDNTLYTGITLDLARRLHQHTQGLGAKYLRGKHPLQLVFSIAMPDRSSASKLEYKIKHLSKAQKLQIIEQNLILE